MSPASSNPSTSNQSSSNPQSSQSSSTARNNRRTKLIATRYDRVAAWLLSSLILTSTLLFCVFFLWLTTQTLNVATARPIYQAGPSGGEPDGTDPRGMDLNMPMAEQASQQTDIETNQIEQAFTMVHDVLGQQFAQFMDPFASDVQDGGRSGGSTGTGTSPRRGNGPGISSSIPREDRWVILYDQTNLTAYARQLDHFQIELGAFGKGRLYFISNLSAASPQVRQPALAEEAHEDEDRLRFHWSSGTLQQYDRSLLQKANIDPADLIIGHFYPRELEDRLAQLELDFEQRSATDILRTRFAIRSDGRGGFEYYVVDQDLR